ncbi:MAG TPA: hypothetical protein VFW03_14955 [Gemmatimonadaceae bacterium]|nr:hypothetical protein [Gemmatimonadaceae bacterium]
MPSPDGERSATTGSLQRWLKAALMERLGYKAAALFFAVVLWLVVSAEEPSEEVVPVRLEASFDTTRVLTSTRPELRALVAGRARDLIKLYEKPPVVRRAVTDDAPDSVAVDLKPADVYIPPDVDAVVRDIQPRTLVLVFDVTLTRRVPVANKVRVSVADHPAGMPALRLTRVVPDSVTITGPRRVVNRVPFVATVDQTVTVHDTGDFMIPLDVKRLAAGVRVQPTEVRLVVQMPPVTRGSRHSALMTALRSR